MQIDSQTSVKSNLYHPILVLITVIFTARIPSVSALRSYDLCMRKVCSGCIAGSLSCQEGGLTRLPDQLSPDIQSMILIGHRFDRTHLTRANFSAYAQQTTQLQRLTIRNCSIERLEAGSLEAIRSLTQLDLSQNKLNVIEPFTFAGLRLELLRLDENHGLRLAPGAFRETTIVSLSMNQCGLQSLNYEDLLPLLTNNALSNLHLSGNKLITLESQLEPIFLRLQSLSIEQNPFVCNCNLQWLTDVLRRRALRRATRALQTHISNMDSDPLNQNTPLDGDLMRPICQSPSRLAGHFVERLNPTDFFCQLPRIEALEVDLSHKYDGSNNSKIRPSNSMTATLKCQVKGSPELQLAWFRRSPHEFGSLSKLSQSVLISPGLVQVQVDQLTSGIFENTRQPIVQSGLQSASVDNLVCFATDLSGNTSSEITLKWPTLSPTYALIQDELNSQTQYPQAVPSNPESDKDLGHSVSRTDLPPDWYLLTGTDPNGFWTQKQFSALHMIEAVVSTFSITLFLFICGCCLRKAHRLGCGCRQAKTPLLYSNSQYPHTLPSGKYTVVATTQPPPSYSSAPTQSGSSVSYPCADNNLTDAQASFTGQLPKYPVTTSDGRLGVDINTTRSIPCGTAYEPIPTATDFYITHSYPDSQTYDVPDLNSNSVMAPPPNIPLPPLPQIATNTLLSRSPHTESGIDVQASPMLMCTMPTIPRDSTTTATVPWPLHTAQHSPQLFNGPLDQQTRYAIAAATLNRMHPNLTQLNAASVVAGRLHGNGPDSQQQQQPLMVTSNPLQNHQLYNYTNQSPRFNATQVQEIS